MGKFLIFVGILCIAVGLFVSYGPKIPFFGKLPGDIAIEKQNFRFYFPLTTCIIVSVLLTLVSLAWNYFKK